MNYPRYVTGAAALEDMLSQQAEFQKRLYGKHPKDFTPAERAEYVRTMFMALVKELGEMTDEVAWKPWATSDHFNRDAYVAEGIDVWHFFLNFLLVADVTAEEFVERYEAKLAKNHQRQDDGYDGVSTKCPGCRRDVNDDGVKCTLPLDGQPGRCDVDNEIYY